MKDNNSLRRLAFFTLGVVFLLVSACSKGSGSDAKAASPTIENNGTSAKVALEAADLLNQRQRSYDKGREKYYFEADFHDLKNDKEVSALSKSIIALLSDRRFLESLNEKGFSKVRFTNHFDDDSALRDVVYVASQASESEIRAYLLKRPRNDDPKLLEERKNIRRAESLKMEFNRAGLNVQIEGNAMALLPTAFYDKFKSVFDSIGIEEFRKIKITTVYMNNKYSKLVNGALYLNTARPASELIDFILSQK